MSFTSLQKGKKVNCENPNLDIFPIRRRESRQDHLFDGPITTFQGADLILLAGHPVKKLSALRLRTAFTSAMHTCSRAMVSSSAGGIDNSCFAAWRASGPGPGGNRPYLAQPLQVSGDAQNLVMAGISRLALAQYLEPLASREFPAHA